MSTPEENIITLKDDDEYFEVILNRETKTFTIQNWYYDTDFHAEGNFETETRDKEDWLFIYIKWPFPMDYMTFHILKYIIICDFQPEEEAFGEIYTYKENDHSYIAIEANMAKTEIKSGKDLANFFFDVFSEFIDKVAGIIHE